jgi:nondiscriminating aspartyl-tRNA synthetase
MASSIKRVLGKVVPGRSGNNSEASSINHPGSPEIPSSTMSSPTHTHTNLKLNTSPADPTPRKSSTAPPESPRMSGIFSRVRRGSLGAVKPSTNHSPIRVVKEKLGLASGESSEDGEDVLLNHNGEAMSKNQLRKHEKQVLKEKKAEEMALREKETTKKKEEMAELAEKEETDAQRERYGVLPTNNYAGKWEHHTRVELQNLDASMIGKEVTFRARIHAMRRMSAHFVFFLLRQGTRTIQGVLEEHSEISRFFLYWAERIDIESVVLVKGKIQEPKTKARKVTGASIHDFEVLIQSLHIEGQVSEHLPYSVYDGELAVKEKIQEDEGKSISLRVRLANRVIDLRTGTSHAIFKIQSGLGQFFREYLDSQGFIEIHTPKLQGGATESGASVFKVDYFGRLAFLAQSPQLAKQMSIASDFGRVYEIGAVFRAENSNTHRHLTEYTGLDLEMAIDEHYHEVLRMLDNTFKHMFKGIYAKYRHEIDVVKEAFPHEDLVWLDETPVLPFAEAVRMLNDSGWRDEQGNKLPEDEDLGTRDEIQLGKVIKEKLKTDYYVIDKFPVNARPFYAMPDPYNPNVSNGFDIFLRGQEILSGGQRIHDADLLLKRLADAKIERSSMEDYVQGFEYGAPPHGGGGIGLERMLMLLLNLGDIRNASLFHRDPRSFPAKPIVAQLRHPEASTMHPPWEGKDRVLAEVDFQPLEKLIANYGDASNTSWLEPRTKLWRDPSTGAAIGYVPKDGFAIIVGDPLCAESQYTKTIAGFLRFLKKETNLKPLWLLAGKPVEEVLAERFNWRTFSVAAEQRVNPTSNPALHDPEIQKKIRHAEKEGIKITDIPNGKEVPKDVQEQIDERVKDWLANRKGKQVHLTNVRLWQDMEHRSYHYTTDKSGTINGLVVLAMLSAEHGWQVKWSLDFPGAPSGAIEYLVMHVLRTLSTGGVTSTTFGGGASASFTAGHNMNGTKSKMLSKAYNTIVHELKLSNKTLFREKLGAVDDPVYIAYPAHGMGPMAVKAILGFFEAE